MKPALTPAQRAAVVELLRCAADGAAMPLGLTEAALALDVWPLLDLAFDARSAAARSLSERTALRYRHSCLEAAQRIEEGSYP